MKRFLILSILTFTLASCKDDIEREIVPLEKGHMALIHRDGEYMLDEPFVEQKDFDLYFKGTWKLGQTYHVFEDGTFKNLIFDMLKYKTYPIFSVKDGGKIRQYIDDNDTKSFKDGEYSYDPSTGILEFKNVMDMHPKFRIYKISGTLRGSFMEKPSSDDGSVLTVYTYRCISDKSTYLDREYGAPEK